MNAHEQGFFNLPGPRHKRRLTRDVVALVGDLMPLFDFIAILLAAGLAARTIPSGISIGVMIPEFWTDHNRAALAAAVLGPFILHDRALVAFISDDRASTLIGAHVARFLMFVVIVIGLGVLSGFLYGVSVDWLLPWFANALLITSLGRWLLVATLRRLEHDGIIVETVAVVGAGPVADRLIRRLREALGDNVVIIGVFDDRFGRSQDFANCPTGSIAELVDLGKSRALDWILITLPDSAEARLSSIVQRLKALAVPVGLCPQSVGLVAAYPGMADRPVSERVGAVPGQLLRPDVPVKVLPRQRRSPAAKLELTLDDHDLGSFLQLAAGFGQDAYGYVVTPNADHLLRLHREPTFRTLYAEAAYVLLDSRFIAHLLRLTRGLRLRTCLGSDLTAALFERVIQPDDHLVLIGGSDEQELRLSARYGLTQLVHFNPPMGFIRTPAAVEACLRFIEAQSPFRYCLLAVGCPQQEMLAQQLKLRGRARGLALCIGASINFLTGEERRAPLWLQYCGMEWLFRLVNSPRRLAKRYLVQGPKLFTVLRRTGIRLRAARR